MASEGRRIQLKVPTHGVCSTSVSVGPPEVRQPEGAGGGLCEYPCPPHPCPASTRLWGRWPRAGSTDGMAVCSHEALVSPHERFTGTASGWFQLSVTQESAGVVLAGCSTPSTPGKGREQGCRGRPKATSSGIPQPAGRTPRGGRSPRRAGLSGGDYSEQCRSGRPTTY